MIQVTSGWISEKSIRIGSNTKWMNPPQIDANSDFSNYYGWIFFEANWRYRLMHSYQLVSFLDNIPFYF